MQIIHIPSRGRSTYLNTGNTKLVEEMSLMELKNYHQSLEGQAVRLQDSLTYADWPSTRRQKTWVSGEIIKVRERIEELEMQDAYKTNSDFRVNPEISFEL